MTFQGDATRQGKSFERIVEVIFVEMGWTIIDRHWREPETDVEIDLIVQSPKGITWWVECKGSWKSSSGRNGSKRSDTAKKFLANAALLSAIPGREERYMLVTSDLPGPKQVAAKWYAIAQVRGWVDAIHVVSLPQLAEEEDEMMEEEDEDDLLMDELRREDT